MSTRISVFCMPEPGHFQLLRPLIAGLVRHGATVSVFTDPQFETQVRAAGATFVDVFSNNTLQLADNSSSPFPCRYVSYAGLRARNVAQEVAKFEPSLIILETFALVGRVVADLLGVPWVNVSPGHNLDPALYVEKLATDPRVQISPSCLQATDLLQHEFRLRDASPFSFVTSISSLLNIYCEPATFLEAEQQHVFQPLAFFGSLPSAEEMQLDIAASERTHSYFTDSTRTRIYVSFGTIVWRYFRNEALNALRSIVAYMANRPNVEGLISLGGVELEPVEYNQLERANVRVTTFVDQHAVLQEADVFVTHNGINSTHESIFHRVPMLSYPFFWDQPALAAKCRQMGLAVPLGSSLRGPVSVEDVAKAMRELSSDEDGRRIRLQRARENELDVMAGRDAILGRLMEFALAARG